MCVCVYDYFLTIHSAIKMLTSPLLARSSISIKCLNQDSLGESKQQSNVFIKH